MGDADARDDAAAVLNQDEQDQRIDLPDPGAGDVPLFSSGAGAYPAASGGGGRRQSRGETRALEDLYAQYPELGKGDWKLHIERTSPRSFRGCRTAGFLGECYERLSTAEFKDRFGGASYCVKVLRPTATGASATKSDYQTVKQFRFSVPGDPTLEGILEPGDEDDMTMKFDPRVLTGVVPERVQIEQIKQQERERERQDAERRRLEEKAERERAQAGQIPPQSFSILEQSTKRMFDDTRAQQDAQTTFWQEEVTRLRSEVVAKDADIQSLRARVSDAERQAADSYRVQESAALREAKDRYDERIREQQQTYDARLNQQRQQHEDEHRRIVEENRDRLDRTETDHRKQLDEMARRHDEERRAADARATEERERMRNDYRDRLDRIERDKEQRIGQLQEAQRERIEDLTRSTAREIDSLREQTRREVDSTREVERSRGKLTEQTAATRVTIMEGENSRLRDEERRSREELRDLQTKAHKEPLQALSEAKDMALQFGGLVEASAAGGDRSWLEQLTPLAKPLTETINSVIDKIGDTRVQNQQARGQAVHAAPGQPAQLPAPQPRYQSAPLGAPPPYAPAGSYQGAPGGNYQSPPIGGATVAAGPNVPFSAPTVNIPSPVQPGGGGNVPLGMGQHEGGGAASEEAVGANATVPVAAAPPAAAAAAAGPLAEFCAQLETVVAGRLLSPEGFARQVIERLGAQQTAALLQQYRPADVIGAAAQLGGAGALQTRDGQRYVGALWLVATQLVGAHLQQAAQGDNGSGQAGVMPPGQGGSPAPSVQPSGAQPGQRDAVPTPPGGSEPGAQAEVTPPGTEKVAPSTDDGPPAAPSAAPIS